MAEFRLKHGDLSDLPSSLPEGDHYIVTKDGINPISPPELYIGPEGGGNPELVGAGGGPTVTFLKTVIDGSGLQSAEFLGVNESGASVTSTNKPGSGIFEVEWDKDIVTNEDLCEITLTKYGFDETFFEFVVNPSFNRLTLRHRDNSGNLNTSVFGEHTLINAFKQY